MTDQIEKMYAFQLDEPTKILKSAVFGYFHPKDLEFFSKEYIDIIKNIDPAEYELHFDCKHLRVTFQDMDGLLAACFEAFKADNFKKVIITCLTNEKIKLRVSGIAENVGLQAFEIV